MQVEFCHFYFVLVMRYNIDF